MIFVREEPSKIFFVWLMNIDKYFNMEVRQRKNIVKQLQFVLQLL